MNASSDDVLERTDMSVLVDVDDADTSGRRARGSRPDVATRSLAALDVAVSDEDLEERLGGVLEQASGSPSRPASSKLSTDQARVLVWLLDGFADRAELLSWMQSLAVQSLGQLPDEWYPRIASDTPMVSALLGRPWGPLREQAGLEDLPPGFAAEARRGVAAEDLLPAFRKAHRRFRWSAGERVEFLDDETDTDQQQEVNPREQQYPAMRPALADVAERTEWALSALLEGFDSPDALLLWVQSTVAIVYAEVDEDAIRGAYFDAPVRDVMLSCDDESAFARSAWAAEYLLPAFNRAVREVAERAGEVISSEGEGDQTPLGW